MATQHRYLVPISEIRHAEENTPSASRIYRNVISKDKMPVLEATTLHELFQGSVRKYGDANCLGWRPIDHATGKADDYQWVTYNEANTKIESIASGLAGLGLAKSDRVGIYGVNCPEWMITMQACNRMSYQCVPIYDTLGENAVDFIINHSETVAAFCDVKKLPQLAKAAEKFSTGLFHHVIYWGEGDAAATAAAVETLQWLDISAVSFTDLLSVGAAKPVEAVPPQPDDYCTLMYTSGTTGDPKGVLIKHSAVVATVSSLVNFLESVGVKYGPGDSVLSYLPLAHIYDRVNEEMMLALGAGLGYWQGHVTKLVDDAAALRPTMFIGVPRVFERVYNRVMDQLNQGSPVKRALFNWAYARKLQALKQGVPQAKAAPFLDKVVFNKVKARLGGRVRLIVSGGAPLAPHVEEFLKVAMCCSVVQGYGLTETCAASCIAVPDTWDMHGTNGPCTPCTELRLESVPEMNYDATAESEPAGEVLLRGPQLFSGYYKEPGKTAEVLDADGWFHTGDIGKITAAGGLKIVDRKKNIFKLSQGEYIAVEKLEAIYKKSPVVEQVWVYGCSFRSSLVAVVVPKHHAILHWAQTKGHKTGATTDVAELCNHPAAVSWMLGELKSVGKENKTKGFEAIKSLMLEPEQFSVENDCLTPTFKFKRPQLQKRYQRHIDDMYVNIEAEDKSAEQAKQAASNGRTN